MRTNKIKHAKTEDRITDLRKVFAQMSDKGYDLLLDRMFFTGDDCSNFLVYAIVVSSITLVNKKNVNYWKLNGILSKSIIVWY